MTGTKSKEGKLYFIRLAYLNILQEGFCVWNVAKSSERYEFYENQYVIRYIQAWSSVGGGSVAATLLIRYYLIILFTTPPKQRTPSFKWIEECRPKPHWNVVHIYINFHAINLLLFNCNFIHMRKHILFDSLTITRLSF